MIIICRLKKSKYIYLKIAETAMTKKTSSIIFQEGFNITSPVMKEIHAEIYDYAYHGRPCILFGPSGAGKEFVARYYYKVFKEFSPLKGPFLSLNCAGLTPTIAISELFGHVRGSFTGAYKDKQGLFEKANNGILFLDEIGDIPTEVQSMLLRAIDPETHEARRLGSNNNYSTGNVIVICATDRSKDSLRLALLSRLGKQVEVPGVDKRGEDVHAAVQFFAHSALQKRRDKDEVINIVFEKQANEDIETPTGENPVIYVAQRIALRLSPMVIKRSWPGNFREIRNAIDTAIIRAKKTKGIENFIKNVEYYYNYHQRNFSDSLLESPAKIAEEKEVPDGSHSEDKNMNEKILKNICTTFPRIAEEERLSWALFLSDEDHRIFYRNELDSVLKFLKKRTIQERLKKLVESGIITRKGERGDEYHLNFETAVSSDEDLQSASLLSLPELNFIPADREKEIRHVMELISNSRGVFISGDRKTGKTTFVFSLGVMLMKTRPVFYHALDDTKLIELFNIIAEKLKDNDIDNIPDFRHDDTRDLPVFAATLSGFLERLFPPDSEPVLILDNTNTLKSTSELKALNVMLQYWKMFSFILVGKKLGNELNMEEEVCLAEYKIKSYS